MWKFLFPFWLLLSTFSFNCHAQDMNSDCGTVGLFGVMLDVGNSGCGVADDRWKAFRSRAVATGQASSLRTRIHRLTGNRTDDRVGYAIYEDRGGEVGPLKASGYVLGYDWTAVGTGEHCFRLDTVHRDREIISGRYYWVAFWSDAGNNACPGRCGAPGTPAYPKRGYVVEPAAPDAHIAREGSAFTVVYGDNCYEWSAWAGPPRVDRLLIDTVIRDNKAGVSSDVEVQEAIEAYHETPEAP